MENDRIILYRVYFRTPHGGYFCASLVNLCPRYFLIPKIWSIIWKLEADVESQFDKSGSEVEVLSWFNLVSIPVVGYCLLNNRLIHPTLHV